MRRLKFTAFVPASALAVMLFASLTGALSRVEAGRTQNGCAP